MKFRYQLGEELITVDVEGDTIRGDARVLLHEDDDLTERAAWGAQGFVVAPFLAESSYSALVDDVTQRLARSLRDAGADVTDSFSLTAYHRHVRDDAMHLAALREARIGYRLDDFPIALDEITDRVGSLLGVRVTARNEAHGLDRWHVRVIRPRSNDHNPLHRDVWLDRLRHAVNIYVPLAGSDGGSSLPLVPGSHHWRESELVRTASGATVNGLSYTVPAVVGSDRPLALQRPNPTPNQVLLFSPYLVHGGARNGSADHTRVSLEMRFWRAP